MLDYSFYNPESKCPPDEIVLEILEKLENGAAAGQILENETRWEVFFHLSALRGNLIAWYPMEAHAEVLEIGAGCGALTDQLCKMASHVDALEACEEKAKINKLINEKADNLSIYVCGLDGFSVNKKYDYITLIDVVANDSSLLERAKKYLKPDGKIIVAIENKFGMKYWSGAKEDHTERYFEGIAGFENVKGVRTFSKVEIERLLHLTGYKSVQFYYPLPDHKMPQVVFSEKYLPKSGELRNISTTYDMERLQLFKEDAVYDSICKDGMFEYFANAFLIFAGQEE